MLPMKKATSTLSLSHSYSFRDDHKVNLGSYKTRIQAIFRSQRHPFVRTANQQNQMTMHDQQIARNEKKRNQVNFPAMMVLSLDFRSWIPPGLTRTMKSSARISRPGVPSGSDGGGTQNLYADSLPLSEACRPILALGVASQSLCLWAFARGRSGPVGSSGEAEESGSRVLRRNGVCAL